MSENQPHAHLGLDTETSGLFDKDRWFLAEGQPRLAAAALLWTSPGFAITREELFYVKPDGWKMQPGATEVNGLTDDFLHEHGVSVRDVAGAYRSGLEQGRVVICFNTSFDLKVMRAEMMRLGWDDWFGRVPHICTMKRLTGVCKIRDETGKIKSPTLAEALAFCKLPQIGAHTAAGDATAAIQIARFMNSIRLSMEPEFQKRRPTNETQKAEEAAGPRLC